MKENDSGSLIDLISPVDNLIPLLLLCMHWVVDIYNSHPITGVHIAAKICMDSKKKKKKKCAWMVSGVISNLLGIPVDSIKIWQTLGMSRNVQSHHTWPTMDLSHAIC